jgi:hypothetical protein
MLDQIRITSSDVERATRTIVALLNDTYSEANFTEGTVVHDLVVRPMATVLAAIEGDVSYLESRLSLKALAEEETESSAVLLDQLASNFFIERKAGRRTTGVIKLLLNSDTAFSVPVGTIFEKSTGVEFAYEAESPLVISSSDLDQEIDSSGVHTGNYVASIYVVGARESIGSGLPPGEFSNMTNSPTGLISIFNDQPFSSAELQESNFVFAGRIKEALSHRGFNTQSSISTVLKDSVPECRSVNVVGGGHPAMRRDLLEIGTLDAIHTLGKINIYSNTGFFVTRTTAEIAEGLAFSSIDFKDATTGVEVPIKSDLGDDIVLYGKVRVNNLPEADPTRADVEANYVEVSYVDYKFARSTDESCTIAPPQNTDAVVVSPASHVAVATFVDNSAVAPLGTDVQVYYPSVKRLVINIAYVRSAGISEDLFPSAFIQSGIVGYIDNVQERGEHLTVSGLYGYITSNFSTFIAAIVADDTSVEYTLLDTAGNLIHFDVDSDTSLSKSKSYYLNSVRIASAVVQSKVVDYLSDTYLSDLQISDETCVLYCSPQDITLTEVS